MAESIRPSGSINRRGFLKRSAAVGAGFWVAGRGAWAQDAVPTGPVSLNEKLNVAFIGVNHRAADDVNDTVKTNLVNVVALCDVDQNYLGVASKRFPAAKTYSDFRKLLEQKDIDAVIIATANHTHAVATAAALHLGKHVYCEKPLTHTVREARVIAELAAKQKRVTQMGTQIHASSNYRRVVELVKVGAIGTIGEVHVWCGKDHGGDHAPTVAEPVPSTLDYDLWVGPAPFHPYNSAYLPQTWRRYWAYGDGTLGDMMCHYADLPFWALDLRYPTKVSAEGPEVSPDCCPHSLVVHWEFPARGELSPVKLTWYQGPKRPAQMADWGVDSGVISGVMFVGAKGNLFADYDVHRLLPEKDFVGYTPPPKTIPESIGHHKEWVTACLKNDPSATTCRFDYSGPLTEAVLLGNVAFRTGKTLEWDAQALKATNAPDADQYLHYEYRKGWAL